MQKSRLVFEVAGKEDGKMARSFDTPQTNPEGVRNKNRFLLKHGMSPVHEYVAGLEHGSGVSTIGKNTPYGVIKGTDALVTNVPNITLRISIADCFPVCVYDATKEVVSLVHAGWRGVLSGVVTRAMEMMHVFYDSTYKDMQVFIGPGLRPCHFEIKQDKCFEWFHNFNYGHFIYRNNGTMLADLPGIIAKQAKEREVSVVRDTNECSFCSGKRYSYRRGDKEERNIAIAAIKRI